MANQRGKHMLHRNGVIQKGFIALFMLLFFVHYITSSSSSTLAIQHKDSHLMKETIYQWWKDQSPSMEEIGINRANPQRTGYYDEQALRAEPDLLWSKNYGIMLETGLVLGKSMIYTVLARRQLLGIDIETGEIRWERYLLRHLKDSPIYANEVIYIAGGDQHLISALDANTGDMLWEFSPPEHDFNICTGIGYHQGIVYGSSSYGVFYALDASSGKVLWFTQLEGTLISPAFLNQQIVIASEEGSLYLLNASNGLIQWKTTLDHTPARIPALSHDTIYLNTKEGTVYALSLDKGEICWSYKTESSSSTSLALTDQWVIVATCCGVYALDRLSGKVQWKNLSSDAFLIDPIIAQDTIYVHTNATKLEKAYLIALDLPTGLELWRKTLEGKYGKYDPFWISPVIKDKTIVLISFFGDIFVLK